MDNILQKKAYLSHKINQFIKYKFIHNFITKIPYAWIIITGLAVFSPVITFHYVFFDDNKLLVDNLPVFQDFGNLTQIFNEDFLKPVTSGYYFRPLFAASLILNAGFGTSPWIFHGVDVLLHILAACLLFAFFQKISGRAAALFLSVLFLVHPAVTQTVAWIPARNDTLVTVFLLFSLISFSHFLERRRNLFLFIHALGFLLALFSKEIAVLLPLVALCFTKFVRKASLQKLEWLKIILVWAGIAGLWYLARQQFLNESSRIGIGDAAQSVMLNGVGIIFYLGKIIFPINLSTYPVLENTSVWYGFAAVLVLLLSLLFSREKQAGMLAFGALWFFAFLLPSLIRPDSFAVSYEFLEHRIYLPLIGILFLLGEVDIIKNLDLNRKAHTAIAGGIIAALVILTSLHLRHFKNGQSYWTEAVRTSPSSAFAHKQLGTILEQTGDAARAYTEYKTALALKPGELLVNYNLGVINLRSGKLTEAERNFKNEIAINDLFDDAHINLAVVYFYQNRLDKGLAELRYVLGYNPQNLIARENLALFYLKLGGIEAAANEIQEIVNRGGTPSPDLLKAVNKL